MNFKIIILMLSVVLVHSSSLPNLICKRNEPKLGKCVKNYLELLKPSLKDGIKAFDIPAMEPLHIHVVYLPLNTLIPKTNITFHHLVTFGFSDFQISKIKVDVSNLILRLGMVFPSLRLHTTFDHRMGSVILSGNVQVNSTDIFTDALLRGKVQEVKGVKKIYFTSLRLNIKPTDYKVEFSHVFQQAETDSIINANFNKNKDEFKQFVMPLLESKAEEIVLKQLNMIFKHFDYDQMLPTA